MPPQAKAKNDGDDEAMIVDEDFCRALEYGKTLDRAVLLAGSGVWVAITCTVRPDGLYTLG